MSRIKPCPPGFMLHSVSKSCTCNDTLRKLDNDIQCDINSQSFSHQHGVWIGYDQLNDLNETVIYHPHCPFDYCMQELSILTLNSTDSQCNYNRSGLICGACNEGYSLTLGGSKCKECSHVYLVLFLPTSSSRSGPRALPAHLQTNCLCGSYQWTHFLCKHCRNQFQHLSSTRKYGYFEVVFIAWLNLDLGIEYLSLLMDWTCTLKVWLQFVFPFYVFALIGVIITISHRSTSCYKAYLAVTLLLY